MNAKKLTLAVAGLGLVIVLVGNVLSTQRSGRLRQLGGTVHQGGQVITLIALSSFLCINVAERTGFPGHASRRATTQRHRGGNTMIILSRVAAVMLFCCGGLVVTIGIAHLASSLLLPVRMGVMGFYELVFGFLVVAGGLALWLIGDIADRTRILFLRDGQSSSSASTSARATLGYGIQRPDDQWRPEHEPRGR